VVCEALCIANVDIFRSLNVIVMEEMKRTIVEMIMKCIVLFCLMVVMGFRCLGAQCAAHRGFSAEFEENTIEAITAAWAAGADIVEIDVHMLADNTIVIFHDDKVAGHDLSALSFSAMQKLTPAYHVPTLVEALDVCPPGKTMLLDIKGSSSGFIDHFVRLMQARDLSGMSVVYQSRDMSVLSRLGDRLDKPALFYVTSLKRVGLLKSVPDADEIAKKLADRHIKGISAKGRQFIDRKYVSAFQKRGLLFYVWTINSAERINYYRELGVDGVITDCPDIFEGGGR